MPRGDREGLGLIAGRGGLPLDVARSARRRGRRLAAIAFHGQTDPRIESEVEEVTWFYPGAIGAVLDALRSAGVRDAVMAGKVPKATLYGDPAALRLDRDGVELIGRLADRRDDSILGMFGDWLQSNGIRLLPQAEFVPELVGGEGPLGRAKPTAAQAADIAFGWPVAKAVAALDIGQTVVVKDRAVLAVEAIEGTDAAIRRGGEFAAGACAVKVAKPGQDPRFDVPTIGLDTASVLIEAKVAALAFEAEQTLVLDRERLVETADAHGIALLGVVSERLPEGGAV